MRKILPFLFLLIGMYNISHAQEIALKGVYQGKNLYIMNPFSSSGVGFCIFEVTVNGQVTTDEINSSAFEVDLTFFQFTKGDAVEVLIRHKEGCTPKVINPEVLKPQSTFVASDLLVDNQGSLNWNTTNESGSLPFIVEQFRWNKWVKVNTVEGKGKAAKTSYKCKVYAHSGNNRFRVKQVDYTRKPRYSKEVRYRSTLPPVSYTPSKPSTEIVFSRETMFEIYDYYGNLVKKGYQAKVDISGLNKGDYFLNYGTKTETFKKR